jgi:hypothetical protein
VNRLPGQPGDEVRREWKPEIRPRRMHAGEPRADHHRPQLATDRFDLGQFGHTLLFTEEGKKERPLGLRSDDLNSSLLSPRRSKRHYAQTVRTQQQQPPVLPFSCFKVWIAA